MVLYGVKECPSDSSRYARLESDLASVVSVLTTLESSFHSQSIKDCYRLGKFNPESNKPRPILIQFVRAVDATNILAKKGKLAHPFYSKPDMTKEKRQVESILMKERWELIQSGVPRNQIKVRNSSIYVYNKMHGRVIETVFVPASSSPNNCERSPCNAERPQPIASPNHSLVTQSPELPPVSTVLLSTKDSSLDNCSPLEPNNGSHSLPLSVSTIATDINSVPDKSKAPCDTSGATD